MLPFAQMSFPEMYERALVGPLFRPWAEQLLHELDVKDGDRVLDIATGTGIVARLAKERVNENGVVVGVDLSPAMISVARTVTPAVDFREGDATSLPLRDGELFNVVVCQQGLQFVPDKPAAVREMRRALTDGGRLAISTWRPDEELPALHALRRIAEKHVGAISDRRHSYGEAGPIETLLRDAGFRDVSSRVESRKIRFADGNVFVALNAMALVGMSASASQLSDDDRKKAVEAITRDSADLVREGTDASGFSYAMAATVVTGNA